VEGEDTRHQLRKEKLGGCERWQVEKEGRHQIKVTGQGSKQVVHGGWYIKDGFWARKREKVTTELGGGSKASC